MKKDNDHIKLVQQAQRGDKESLNRLAKLARERIRTDIYRLTLDDDLTEEIAQETIMKMLRTVGQLSDAEKFWPWLSRIAVNKVNSHHRHANRRKTVPLSQVGDSKLPPDGREAIAEMVTAEFKEIVLTTMDALKPKQRAVLTMRCYRDMKYSEIAESVGCTTFSAKKMFYRARKAFEKQLSRKGFGKGSFVLAMALFGRLTAPTKAAAAQVTVSAAAAKASMTAALAVAATSKVAVVTFSAAAAVGSVAVVGSLVSNDGARGRATHSPVIEPPVTSQPADKAEADYWYYYPDGSHGPVMMRILAGKTVYVPQRHNEEGNFYYDSRKKRIHIDNHRPWHSDLSVWQLPGDGEKLGRFLAQLERRQYSSSDISSLGAASLVIQSGDKVWAEDRDHVVIEEWWQPNWPANAKVEDNRDAMHRRGWTYFTITGRIKGHRVRGTGRIPFVYGQTQKRTPWLTLNIGDKLRFVDTSSGAIEYKGRKAVATYKAGTFFKGLSRPWMGLHTIDTVRRDAAEQGVPFETDYDAESKKAQVILTYDNNKLTYTIDMETDVVEQIDFSNDEGDTGMLRFDYKQNIEAMAGRFNQPSVRSNGQKKPAKKLWLINLPTKLNEQ